MLTGRLLPPPVHRLLLRVLLLLVLVLNKTLKT
jgi:hypothetical protein